MLALSLFIITISTTHENAGAKGIVCLYDSTNVIVKSDLTASITVHRAFEITGETGQEYAQVAIPVNDYIVINDIKGYTELRGGERVKLAKADIQMTSASGFSGFGGMSLVIFTLRNPSVGARLFYDYNLQIRSLLYLPLFIRNTNYPTNRYSLDVSWDRKVNLRFDAGGVEITRDERSLHFGASNLAELPKEKNSCPDPLYILLSADVFSYNKMKYRSRTWAEVGRFFAQLATQPEASMADARTLAKRLSEKAITRLDTLNAFFNFVADSVSYVSLQVGKGDFNPHDCSVIINRRFGDCKDQSILLSSLCRIVGINAFPALICTGNYPTIDSLSPWPVWFDHAVTVIKESTGDLILDPSDPRASVTSLPPRLRGKEYLICDGFSNVKATPPEADPAFLINWEFDLNKIVDGRLGIDFILKYINDASDIYGDAWNGRTLDQVALQVESQLKNSGWNASSLKMKPLVFLADSLIVDGSFEIGLSDLSASGNLAIASPVIVYILDNLFPDVRQNDLCPGGSIQLEETITIDRTIPGLENVSVYDESWQREGLIFKDQLSFDDGNAIYHRLFFSSGDLVKVGDYNQFRDFVLSRRDQQYVKLQK